MDDRDKALIEEIKSAKERIQANLENYKFRDGLFEVVDLARKGNKYMQEKQPWIEARRLDANDPENADGIAAQKLIDNCLHLCLQHIANLAILVNPFLPFTAKKLCHMMKVVDRMLDWENAGKIDLLKVNYPLRAPELLFRKIEDAEVTAQVEKLRNNLKQSKVEQDKATNNTTAGTTEAAAPTQAAEVKQGKAEIQFDDFAKIDLRVGTILTAEKVEKADKLLKLEVDMGTEKRTIVSGIAMHFKPEDIVGKQVTVVANLAPRKMRGIESQGMILMAENKDGKLIFVSPLEMADAGGEVK